MGICNIDNLYVVLFNSSDKKLICKKDFFDNKYIEILSENKIDTLEDAVIISLREYCGDILKNECDSSVFLKLKDIRNLYIKINESDILDIKCNADLDNAIINFFPTNGMWNLSCLRKPNNLVMDNLPCHLRDYNWMAKLLKKQNQLINYSDYDVVRYISNSSLFLEKRYEYEQLIVRSQINYMINGGGGFLASDGAEEIEFLCSHDIDLLFRDSVKKTLLAIGIDSNAIEEGLESNIDFWYPGYLSSAFDHRYNPLVIDFRLSYVSYGNHLLESMNKDKLEPASLELKDVWMRLRRYNYYKRHKDSIDKYGKMLPEYQITEEEYKELSDKLNMLNDIRMKEIENFENKRKAKRLK